MKKLLGIFKRRWVMTLLGLSALALIILFAGPYLAFADYRPLEGLIARLVCIGLVFLGFGLHRLWKRLRAAKASEQIMQGISQAPPPSPEETQSVEEVAALKERFEEAVSLLKKAARKGQGPSLYDLPWYIIIGPPGSGKTTALRNSGLEFPLAERYGKDAVRGVGGTRNCDWWFTNEAVLLDTAGRYTTQDSQAAVDSAAWQGFLGLLKKYRRRQPINGALVAMSLADLLTQSPEERLAHARAIHQRILELRQSLGVRFPVYFMFTKCDLLAGFTEFFEDLGKEERAQVWGMSFALAASEAGAVDQFGAEFDALMTRLDQRLWPRLQQERDLQRRALIYGFPQQLAALKPAMSEFLRAVFGVSRFEEASLLRGVYFTSGTQEGAPIDRLVAGVARTFRLERQMLASFTGHGRSYFLTDLLKRVVFPEARIVGSNRRFEIQRAWLQRGAYAAALLVTVVAAVAWSASFTANKRYVGEVQASLAAYQAEANKLLPDDADFSALLPRLDALKQVVAMAQAHADHVPWYMRLWLYQGNAIGESAQDAYVRELNALLRPRVATRIEQQLRAAAGNPDAQYQLLKLYLMLNVPARLDPAQLGAWMSLDWETTLPPNQYGPLEEHFQTLLKEGVRPVGLDQGLVHDARLGLRQVSLAQLVYGRLKRDYLARDEIPFRVIDVVGESGQKVFARKSGAGLDAPIPGLYTYRGYYEVYLPQSEDRARQIQDESWVLGTAEHPLSQAELQELETNINKLYQADYERYWDELLSDLRIVPFTSVGQAAEVVGILSGPTSPLRALLDAVVRNTTLTERPGGKKTVGDLAKQAAEKTQLSRLVEGLTGKKTEVAELPPEQVIERHYVRLSRLVRGEGGAPPLDQVMALLSDLYGYLNSLSGALPGASLQAAQQGGGDILRRVQIEAARQPAPLSAWLAELGGGSRAATVGGARGELNAKWTGTILPQCERALAGRYPFFPNGTREVTLDDFAQLFGPGGLLDKFFMENLQPFIDTSGGQWRVAAGAGLVFSDEALRQFRRAQAIKQTYFQGGGNRPGVRFALKPLYLDAEVSQFLLDIDGQQFTYRHGPARPESAQWPGSAGPPQTRVIFEGGGQRASLSKEGTWAWFRVLDQSRVEVLAPDRIAVSFEVEGRKARYELQASSVFNPFVNKDVQAFRCPARL